jgi:hypothetical protein
MDPTASEILERVRHFALPGPTGPAWGMRLRQTGEIRLNLNRPWRSFEAHEDIDARKLEFRWAAKVRVAPMVHATMTEAFQDGHGSTEGRLLGVQVQRAAGAEIDATQLIRLMSELIWCPMALGHPDLVFDSVDSRTLRVGLKHDGALRRVTIRVDDVGRVLEAKAEGRPRLIGKATLAADWFGRFGDYKELDGVRMPVTSELAWALPDGRFTYLRGRIVEAGLIRPPRPTTSDQSPA